MHIIQTKVRNGFKACALLHICEQLHWTKRIKDRNRTKQHIWNSNDPQHMLAERYVYLRNIYGFDTD